MDIVGKRYLYFLISLILIVPGLVGLIIWGLPLSIDFSGGSVVELRFNSTDLPPLQDIRDIYGQFGFDNARATSGVNELVVRSKHMDDATNAAIIAALEEQFGTRITMLRFCRECRANHWEGKYKPGNRYTDLEIKTIFRFLKGSIRDHI